MRGTRIVELNLTKRCARCGHTALAHPDRWANPVASCNGASVLGGHCTCAFFVEDE